jgi:hypothetical protein
VLPFDVLVTSAGTALIQLIPDSTSIHSIKARSAAAAAAAAAEEAAAAASPRTPSRAATADAAAAAAAASGDVSLSQHFFAKWRRGTAECLAAQRRFVESLAAYSLVMYLLQVHLAGFLFLVHALRLKYNSFWWFCLLSQVLIQKHSFSAYSGELGCIQPSQVPAA